MAHRKDSLALLLLASLIVFFAGEMVWGDKLPLYRDLGTYFYPMRFSLAESFKTGALPLWDRHVAMGYPLLADFQSGAFYPPHLLYLILPFFAAVRVLFVVHYLIGGVGTYLIFRRWGYPPFLAVIAGVLFTLGGTMVSLTNVLNHFQAAVWLPWVVLCADQFFRERRWKTFLLLTAVLTVQFLAGSPEIYLMTQALVLVYCLRVAPAGARGPGAAILTLAGANLIVAGLSMAQILPTLELFSESRARVPFTLGEATDWSLRPLNLLNFFFIDKAVDAASYTSPKLFFSGRTPFLLSYYMGALVPLGALLWLYYGSRREKLVVLALIGFSLAAALGSYTPLYPFLFTHLPFFKIFRFPEKFVFITYAALLYATLAGLKDFLQSEFDWRRPFFLASLLCVAELLLYGYLRWHPADLSRFMVRSIHNPAATDATLKRASLFFVHFETALALGFGILAILILKKTGRLRPWLFAALFTALTFGDLYSAHRSYQFLAPTEIMERSPRLLESPDVEPNRLFYYPGPADVHPSYFTMPRELPLNEFHAVVFGSLLPNQGALFGFDYMQELDALGRWPYLAFLGEARKLERSRLFHLLGALNIQYVTALHALPEEGIATVRAIPERNSWLYRIDKVVPRTYIVQHAVVEADTRKTIALLASPEFDAAKTAVVQEDPALSASPGARANARIARYANTTVDIEASLDAPGILVLADSYYPGWRVYVDDKEGEILRANLFFRGVKLAAGMHRVEFRYEPRSFQSGLWISLTTLAGLTLASVVGFVRKQKRRGVSADAPRTA